MTGCGSSWAVPPWKSACERVDPDLGDSLRAKLIDGAVAIVKTVAGSTRGEDRPRQDLPNEAFIDLRASLKRLPSGIGRFRSFACRTHGSTPADPKEAT